MSEEAVQLVERFFSGIAEGSIDATLAVLDDNVEWTPTIWAGSGTYWGLDEVRRWFSEFGERLEWMRIDLKQIESADGGAFADGVVHDSREGRSYAAQRAWYFEVEEGRIIRGQVFTEIDEARAAAGLPPPAP